MDYGDKYLESQLLTGNPVTVTILMYENILQKIDYVDAHFDASDIESFESEIAMEKLDRAERLVEELHMQISHLTEKPFPTLANAYGHVVETIQLFRTTYDKALLENIRIIIRGMKEGYEEVANRNE